MLDQATPDTMVDDSEILESSPEWHSYRELARMLVLPPVPLAVETRDADMELEPTDFEFWVDSHKLVEFLNVLEASDVTFNLNVVRTDHDESVLADAVRDRKKLGDSWPTSAWIAEGRLHSGSTIATVRLSTSQEPQGFATIYRSLTVTNGGDGNPAYFYQMNLENVYVKRKHRGQGLAAALAFVVGSTIQSDIEHLSRLARSGPLKKRFGWIEPHFEVHADLYSRGGESFAMQVHEMASVAAECSFTKAEWKRIGRHPRDFVEADIGF